MHPTSGRTGTVSASSRRAPDTTAIEHDSGAGPAFQNWPHASLLVLAARRTDVSCGRLHARNVLWEWKLAHLANDAVISSPHLGVSAVTAAGVLCAFSCVVDALSEQCLRRRPAANLLVAAAFRTNWLQRERCAATCQRRRRPGQARRRQGRLQITAALRGLRLKTDR
jgi:hypothetical protein